MNLNVAVLQVVSEVKFFLHVQCQEIIWGFEYGLYGFHLDHDYEDRYIEILVCKFQAKNNLSMIFALFGNPFYIIISAL